MKFGFCASLACVAFCTLLASCATTANEPTAAKDPCLGVAPAVGTAIVRKEDCGAGRKQTAVSAPASGGVVWDKKLERSGQAGR